jgi:hypothetical protein
MSSDYRTRRHYCRNGSCVSTSGRTRLAETNPTATEVDSATWTRRTTRWVRQ